jgi:hypothetical protein
MIPIFPIDFPHINQNANTEVTFMSINDQNYGEKWKRTGYCSRCGNCCDDIENIFAEVDGDGNPGGLEQVVPGKCAYFRWSEDGLAGCVGRETQFYNNGCAFAPSKIEHIVNWPNCTYNFEKIEDGN